MYFVIVYFKFSENYVVFQRVSSFIIRLIMCASKVFFHSRFILSEIVSSEKFKVIAVFLLKIASFFYVFQNLGKKKS